MTASISEIFYSPQGEGLFIGLAQVFIRFSGCPFDCPYCDTDFSPRDYFDINGNTYKNPVSAKDLSDILIKEFGKGVNFHSYSFTGGEPLLYDKYIYELALILKTISRAKLFIETSGLMPYKLSQFDGILDIMSVDIKTHSKTVLENLPALLDVLKNIKKTDWYLKLLLPDENNEFIIDYAAETLKSFNINRLVVQPVNNVITEETVSRVFNKCYDNGITARVIPQTNKILSLR